ncbi:MAG: alpha/beta fold hydrolase, partial [Hyphomicrobiaceae bacterium]|nr:alpha/beta fold hydrolase [Hyphomicrobiaceae bacterium]
MGLFVLLLAATGLILLLGVGALVHALRHPPRQTFAVALGRSYPTDPTDLGKTGQAITFTLSDQTTTPGWILPGDDAAGPVVILLHGYGDGRYSLLLQAQHVLPFASHVVVYDQRGQGESQAPTSTGSLIETQDLLHLIDHLPLDTQDLVLVCYSMGAGVALAAG